MADSFNLQTLLSREHLNPLGPGATNEEVRHQLTSLAPAKLVAPRKLTDESMAQACLAGLWLLHDFLDESHKVSQDLHTTEGSYWHGLMHRREPDFANSKYWFRRVGEHPIFATLRDEAAAIAESEPQDKAAHFLTKQKTWDPYSFIDLCEAASLKDASCITLCERIQRREWAMLFDYCFERAAQ